VTAAGISVRCPMGPRSRVIPIVFPSNPSTAVAPSATSTPSFVPGTYRAWSGPGWYLQKPYLIVAGGPQYLGGPYTYEQCEEERIKLPPETRSQLLCVRENRRPDRYGFF